MSEQDFKEQATNIVVNWFNNDRSAYEWINDLIDRESSKKSDRDLVYRVADIVKDHVVTKYRDRQNSKIPGMSYDLISRSLGWVNWDKVAKSFIPEDKIS